MRRIITGRVTDSVIDGMTDVVADGVTVDVTGYIVDIFRNEFMTS